MSIPTGADFHICRAKCDVNEIRDRLNRGMDTADCVRLLTHALDAMIRALELIQKERQE